MSTKDKIIFKSAFFIVLTMVGYFFLLRGFHLDDIPALRIFNFLFIIIGTSYAIRKNIFLTNKAQYWGIFFVGIYTSILSVILCLTILTLYVNYVHPNFLHTLQNSFFFWKNNFSFPLILFIIFIQGVIVSVISVFIIMWYWKKAHPIFWNKKVLF